MKRILLGLLLGLALSAAGFYRTDPNEYAEYRERIFGGESGPFTVVLGNCRAVGQVSVWQDPERMELSIVRGIDPEQEQVLLEPGDNLPRC